MAASEETAQNLEYRLDTGNQIAWDAKVYLQVVISEEDNLRELGMTCYFVTDIYGANLWFAISLKTLVDWAEDNRGDLSNPTLPTITIPPSNTQVHPSGLWSTRSHIAPQLLAPQFPLH